MEYKFDVEHPASIVYTLKSEFAQFQLGVHCKQSRIHYCFNKDESK